MRKLSVGFYAFIVALWLRSTAAAGIASLAVPPFENLTADLLVLGAVVKAADKPVVIGSYLNSGRKIRLTARRVKVETGEIFDLEDTLAKNVLNDIQKNR